MAKKFSLSGLFGFLEGKGVRVKLNEEAAGEDEQFELVEDGTTPPLIPEPAVTNPLFSEEEVKGLKTLLATFAEVEPEAFTNALKGIPAALSFIQNAEKIAESDKANLIASIKANSANTYTEEELTALPVSVLNKMDAQMNVNYMAMGGAQEIYANEDVLQPKPALFGMVEQEATQ